MSRISALATAFEQSATERQRATDEAVRSALQRHESALLAALSSSEQRTKSAIAASQKRLTTLALGSWLLLATSVAAAMALSAAMIWWQASKLQKNHRELRQQRATIEALTEAGGAIRLTDCEGRKCAAIDPSAPEFKGKDGTTFRVLEGY